MARGRGGRIRWGRAIGMGLVLAVIAGVAGLAVYAARALPQVQGEARIAGLAGAVTITRDAHGVPTISAASWC